jgi:hypothetical protein
MAVTIHSPTDRTPAHWVATGLGIVFLLLGIAGFVSPGVMGMRSSSTLNLVHLVTGLISLYFGLAGSMTAARAFCYAFGIAYGLLGIAGMLAGTPGTSPADARLLRLIPGSLELGTMDHAFHIVVGGVYLIAGLMTHAPRSGMSHPHHAPLAP